METNRLEEVILQNAKYRKAMSYLIDSIYGALHNGAFHGRSFTHEKCVKGYTSDSFKHGLCPHIQECDECRCPFSFDSRRMFKQLMNLVDVSNEPMAALIPFEHEEIPQVDPTREYVVTDEWFARRMMRLLIACRNEDYNPKATTQTKSALGESYYRLLMFGLSTIGYRNEADELNKMWHTPPPKPNEANLNNCVSKETIKVIREAYRLMERADTLNKAIKKAPSRAMRYMVLFAITCSLEYSWSHEYPSADKAVYSDYFGALYRLCSAAMKIKEDDLIGRVEFLNASEKKGHIISWPRK